MGSRRSWRHAGMGTIFSRMIEANVEKKIIVDSGGCEFGYELISVVPYANWLHQCGRLQKTVSSLDTRWFYPFSPAHFEGYELRRFAIPEVPNGNVHVSELDETRFSPPNYAGFYKNDLFVYSKPLCIIYNKYQTEWGGEPVNYLSVDVLETLFELLKHKFQIVYVRPGAGEIVEDNSSILELGDMDRIALAHPEILTIQQLETKFPFLAFNQLQLLVMANCRHFISVQGGCSVLCSYFGGKNFIFAKAGRELGVGSFNNWYGKLSGASVRVSSDYCRLVDDVERSFAG